MEIFFLKLKKRLGINNYRTNYELGNYYSKIKNYNLAVLYYECSIRQNNFVNELSNLTYYELGKIYYNELKLHNKSIDCFIKISNHFIKDTNLYIGHHYFNRNKFDVALKYYNYIIFCEDIKKYNQTDILTVYNNVGKIYQNTNDIYSSIKYYLLSNNFKSIFHLIMINNYEINNILLMIYEKYNLLDEENISIFIKTLYLLGNYSFYNKEKENAKKYFLLSIKLNEISKIMYHNLYIDSLFKIALYKIQDLETQSAYDIFKRLSIKYSHFKSINILNNKHLYVNELLELSGEIIYIKNDEIMFEFLTKNFDFSEYLYRNDKNIGEQMFLLLFKYYNNTYESLYDLKNQIFNLIKKCRHVNICNLSVSDIISSNIIKYIKSNTIISTIDIDIDIDFAISIDFMDLMKQIRLLVYDNENMYNFRQDYVYKILNDIELIKKIASLYEKYRFFNDAVLYYKNILALNLKDENILKCIGKCLEKYDVPSAIEHYRSINYYYELAKIYGKNDLDNNDCQYYYLMSYLNKLINIDEFLKKYTHIQIYNMYINFKVDISLCNSKILNHISVILYRHGNLNCICCFNECFIIDKNFYTCNNYINNYLNNYHKNNIDDYYCENMNFHIFCKECLSNYVETDIELKINNTCLDCNCNCIINDNYLKESLIYTNSSKLERFDEINDIIKINELSKLDGYYICPKCKRYVVFIDLYSEEIKNIKCYRCQHEWCRYCKGKSHDFECNIIDDENNIEGIITIVNETISNCYVNCPSCKVKIEKIDGCNKITCKCGTNFCYLCNLIIKQKNNTNYWHFKGSGSYDNSSNCDLYSNDNSHIENIKINKCKELISKNKNINVQLIMIEIMKSHNIYI